MSNEDIKLIATVVSLLGGGYFLITLPIKNAIKNLEIRTNKRINAWIDEDEKN